MRKTHKLEKFLIIFPQNLDPVMQNKGKTNNGKTMITFSSDNFGRPSKSQICELQVDVPVWNLINSLRCFQLFPLQKPFHPVCYEQSVCPACRWSHNCGLIFFTECLLFYQNSSLVCSFRPELQLSLSFSPCFIFAPGFLDLTFSKPGQSISCPWSNNLPYWSSFHCPWACFHYT